MGEAGLQRICLDTLLRRHRLLLQHKAVESSLVYCREALPVSQVWMHTPVIQALEMKVGRERWINS